MLKYNNDYIINYINENYKNFKIVSIDGNGKEAIVTLWCGVTGHKHIQCTFANLLYKDSFHCRECKKDDKINEIKKIIGDEYKIISIDYISNDWIRSRAILWCGIEGHEYIDVSFKSIINGNIIGCKLCRKNKHILKIKENVEKVNKKLIEVKKYNEKDYHKSRIIVSCGNEKHELIETSLNKIINSNVKCKDCIKEDNINKMMLYINSTQYKFNKIVKYCESDYIKSMVEITCPKDETHIFTMRFSNFKYEGKRCPHCGMTYGEQEVANVLKRYNIKYKFQYKYKDCRFINPLPFDFYLPDYNILIEYDGKQHYESVDLFGGEKGFKYTKQNDGIKNQYCKNNNIKLIRIPYWCFNNIEEILIKELKVNINKYE